MGLPVESVREFLRLDQDQPLPLHLQLRRGLRELIQQYFVDGERFYSEPALIGQLGISQGTVRRALVDLTREGLLDRQPAKGSFVRRPASRPLQIDSIGLFIPAFESAFLAALVEQFAIACQAANRKLQPCYVTRHMRPSEAIKLLADAADRQAVAITSSTAGANELLSMLIEREYRTVVLDSQLASNAEGSFIGTDNHLGVQLGIEHLIELGHRDICFVISEPPIGGATPVRLAAYESTMKRQRLPIHILDCRMQRGDDAFAVTYNAMDNFIAQRGPITALMTVSDAGAWGILKWCSEHGVRVPADLSVLGFDDDRPSRFTTPGLSTIAQPVADIALRVVNKLVHETWQPTQEFLAPTLVHRQSTGPGPMKSE